MVLQSGWVLPCPLRWGIISLTPSLVCSCAAVACRGAYVCVHLQDAGAQLPTVEDVVAAGGVASTFGGNTNYNFNASVPAQREGFFSILQTVRVRVSHAASRMAVSLLPPRRV